MLWFTSLLHFLAWFESAALCVRWLLALSFAGRVVFGAVSPGAVPVQRLVCDMTFMKPYPRTAYQAVRVTYGSNSLHF